MTQADLFVSPAPVISTSQVESVIRYLSGRGWVKARELAAEYNERTLRAIASESKGRILSGQRGYILIEEATVDEANHAAAWLRHQGQEMIRRAHDIEQAMHRRHRTEAA